MEDKFYDQLENWKKTSRDIVGQIYLLVRDIPAENFGVGPDWVTGYRRDLASRLIEKGVPPYNYYRDRMLEKEREDMVEFVPAGEGEEASEEMKRVSWAPEGVAFDKEDHFLIQYLDGRPSAKVDKKALKTKNNNTGEFWTIRIKDIPTNIFPKGKDGKDGFSVHEYKAR